MKLNNYFYKVYLPVQVLSLVGLTLLMFGYGTVNWLQVFIVWFLIGPVGIGVGFHKLFSHRQFSTYRPIEILLATLGTLSTYGPIIYWISEHQHHHKFADTEKDINNPSKGFWHSFFYWRFTLDAEHAILIKDRGVLIAIHDPVINFLNKHFNLIVYTFAIVTLLSGLDNFLSIFVLPILIEQLRLNLLNSVAHLKLLGSYQNFAGKDNSYNNIILGYITFGFGWHNNHHNNPRELINQHNWYEVDIEGCIGKLISKKS